ncbi:MAG: peptidase S24 [Clostridiales bacterium]|nr:peptidase S24 [Clostridiales bacterium]
MIDQHIETLSIKSQELTPLLAQVLEGGGQFKLLVTGDSMSPFLGHLRDSVILKEASGHKLKRGDIVLIRRRESDRYVLHRIIKMKPDGFIMNGDAQNWDEFVPFEQVVAVVSKIERKGRLISCDSRGYRFLSWLWMLLRPFRGLLFKVIGVLAVIRRKIKPSKK